MTEAEWLTCPDPDPMLLFLRERGSERKLRLFACACSRRVLHLLEDQRTCRVVELAELNADGLATADEVWVAARLVEVHTRTLLHGTASHIAASAALAASAGAAWPAAWNVIAKARSALRHDFHFQAEAESCQQRWVLVDVFGNPFNPPALDQSWLRWNDATVPKIARGIYEERAFGRLPILHDALLDAGCDNEDMLAHCRGDGPHVPGCWVIDLILGKS
jgi:hypothetical protein